MAKFAVFGLTSGAHEIIEACAPSDAEQEFIENSGDDDNAIAIGMTTIKKIAKEN